MITLLPVVACAYSGHLEQTVQNGPGGVEYRAGSVSYLNDSKAERRKNDATKKIEKYCGTEGYVITKETNAPEGATSELQFRCGQTPPAKPESPLEIPKT